MGVNIIFNPFTLIAEIAEKLWPEINCNVYFADTEHFQNGAKALTNFPVDGGKPEICISPDVPFSATLELLSHELSHVVAGESAGHGPEWESVFSKIHEEYKKHVEALPEEIEEDWNEEGQHDD